MRTTTTTVLMVLTLGLAQGGPALAQAPTISDADCQSLRLRLGEHARLSDGVRKAVATQAAAAPAAAPAPAAPSTPAATGRAEAIRARLEQIPKDRQTLEDQRLGAMVKFELSRASQIQGQIQALDAEKAALEREQAALPAAAQATTPTTPSAPVSDVARIRCQDMPAAVDNAMKIRRRELGAQEGQAGAIPLIALKGQTADQIGQELAGQFSPGAAAGSTRPRCGRPARGSPSCWRRDRPGPRARRRRPRSSDLPTRSSRRAASPRRRASALRRPGARSSRTCAARMSACSRSSVRSPEASASVGRWCSRSPTIRSCGRRRRRSSARHPTGGPTSRWPGVVRRARRPARW